MLNLARRSGESENVVLWIADDTGGMIWRIAYAGNVRKEAETYHPNLACR